MKNTDKILENAKRHFQETKKDTYEHATSKFALHVAIAIKHFEENLERQAKGEKLKDMTVKELEKHFGKDL
jgi:hypothetical protein